MRYRERLVHTMHVVRRLEDGQHAELEVEVRGRRALREVVLTSTTYRTKPFKLTRDEHRMARGLLWAAGIPEDAWDKGQR